MPWSNLSKVPTYRNGYPSTDLGLDFFTTRAYVTFALTVRVEMTVYLLTYLLTDSDLGTCSDH